MEPGEIPDTQGTVMLLRKISQIHTKNDVMQLPVPARMIDRPSSHRGQDFDRYHLFFRQAFGSLPFSFVIHAMQGERR